MHAGELFYENVIIGYESPRHISFLNDGWLQYRVELEFEKQPHNVKYPTRMVYRLSSRRNSVLFKVRTTTPPFIQLLHNIHQRFLLRHTTRIFACLLHSRFSVWRQGVKHQLVSLRTCFLENVLPGKQTATLEMRTRNIGRVR